MLYFDYRLAPEHPFPAALEDAMRAYRSVLDGADASDVAVVGDSSGGGLATSLLLAARDEGVAQPGRVVLMCPWVDLTGASQQHQAPDAPLIVTPEQIATFAELYLGGHPRSDPVVNPLTADLAGLPPLLVQAGTGDNLAEDSRRLVERAVAAGVEAALEMYPVATHDFHLFWSFLPEAADALHRAGQFINADPMTDAAGASR